MSAADTFAKLGEFGVILVVRADDADLAVEGVRAVVEGGIRAVEVTYTVPDAAKVLRTLASALGDQILMGAGTVTTVDQAQEAADCGAQYLVSPHTDEKIVAKGLGLDMPMLPGAFTPTEVVSAWKMGATGVKIFPASVGGASYIKALKGPLPHIPMIPTGGVSAKNVNDFIDAGSYAVGAGGSLFDAKKLAAKDWKGMTAVAKEFVEALVAARKEPWDA